MALCGGRVAMSMTFFVLGVLCGLPFWLCVFHVMEKLDSPLHYKNFVSILPDPNNPEWTYIGDQYVPKVAFTSAPCYKLNQVRIYIGHGAFVNDSYLRGSGKYAKLVLDGQTHNKMLQEALGE